MWKKKKLSRIWTAVQPQLICLPESVQALSGSPATLHSYRGRRKQGGGACWRKTLAILDGTRPHKHGALSPESLHAESQWGRPEKKKKKTKKKKKKKGRVNRELLRSERGWPGPRGGGVFPWVAAPHVRDGWQRPCSRVDRANVRSVPQPLPPSGTHSVTFERHTHSSLEGTRGGGGVKCGAYLGHIEECLCTLYVFMCNESRRSTRMRNWSWVQKPREGGG